MSTAGMKIPGMKIFGIAIVAGLAVLTPAAAQTRPQVIAVTGEASVSAVPDLATIDGGVVSEAKTAREASDVTNKAMAAVLAALKGAGIADSDIQTSRISLQPQSNARSPAQSGTPQIIAYRASNRVTVRIRDINKIASTIDTLVGAGANDIGGIDFVVTKESELLDDARAKAIADAKRKAQIYAKAAGVTLGPAVSINEDGASPPMPMQMRTFKAGAVSPVSPGEETLRVSVNVSFEIKPAAP